MPRAIQSVSASRSKVKAQAARVSRGQRGGVPAGPGGAVIGEAHSSRLGCSMKEAMQRALEHIRRLEENISRALVGRTTLGAALTEPLSRAGSCRRSAAGPC